MSERKDPQAGPFGNLPQTYFTNFETAMKGSAPVLRGVARFNLELAGLMSRRAQAWMGLPARLAQCKSPVEAVAEQLKFWQMAASDYVEGAQKLAAAASAAAVLPGLNGTGGKGEVQPRDYITFPEAKEATPAAPAKRDRRAA